jgi:hypothetical protein
MKRLVKGMLLAAAFGLVAPAVAQTADDAKDTGTQLKHDTKRKVRSAKPGGETAGDKVEDAKDASKSKAAKTKKKARKAGRHAKRTTRNTTDSATK